MAKTLNHNDLAQAINGGKSLVQIAEQAGCTSLTVARVLYGHYVHATSLAGLTGQALRHYMTLRHDAVRLCQKAGVGPLRSREEDTGEMSPRLKPEKLAQLSRAALAGDLAAGRSVAEMARKRNVTEKTILGYLHRHGLRDAKPRNQPLSGTAAAGKPTPDAPQRPAAPQSPSEAAGAIRPPSEGNPLPTRLGTRLPPPPCQGGASERGLSSPPDRPLSHRAGAGTR